MSKLRKTRDEWRLHMNYGHGWEHEVSEDTFVLIRERSEEYRNNCPQYARKITGPHRVKITD